MEAYWTLVVSLIAAAIVAGIWLWRQQDQRAARGLRDRRQRELPQMPTRLPPD